MLKPQTRNKYGAKKTSFDGISFASKAEAHRYAELLILQRAGLIENLKCQPRFPMKIDGALICTYVADFSYNHKGSAEAVIEDVKSPATKTAVYRLKAKMMMAIHGIKITEVMRG